MPIPLDMSGNYIERQILDDLHRSGDQNVSDLVSLAVVKKMEGQLDDLVAEGTLKHYSIKVENVRRTVDHGEGEVTQTLDPPRLPLGL
jgi:hypothetical protein